MSPKALSVLSVRQNWPGSRKCYKVKSSMGVSFCCASRPGPESARDHRLSPVLLAALRGAGSIRHAKELQVRKF